MTTTHTEISDLSALPAMPVVSVPMLAYRHEKFVSEAIEGILAQKCDFPFELVIAEDCSPDATREIVLGYQRRFPSLIRVLISDRNVGMLANAARCLGACRGQFIAGCEGDDYWHHPRKIAMQVEALRQNPAAQLVHTDFDRRKGSRILRNANMSRPPVFSAQGEASFAALLHEMSIVTATSMFRAKLLDELQAQRITSPKWPFGDYPVALYAASKGPIIYLPVSTATYRHVTGSATNLSRFDSLQMRRAALDCAEAFMKLRAVNEEIARSVRTHAHRTMMRQAMLCGDGQTYRSEHTWLVDNHAAPGRLSYLAGAALIRFPILLRVYRTGLRMIRELRYLTAYRPTHR